MEQNFDYKINFQRGLLLQFANSFNDSNAVIGELIANAYDANASQVIINIDTNRKTLTVEDNGIGMNVNDIKDSFLTIGKNKRENKDYLNKKRRIMGRKGNGRLGVFSFANKMNVTSLKENDEICNVILDLRELVNDDKNQPYADQSKLHLRYEISGTKIILSEIEADLSFIFEKLAEYISLHFSHVLYDEDDVFNIQLIVDDKNEEISLRPKIFNKLDRFIPITTYEKGSVNWDQIIQNVKNSTLPSDENDKENGYDPNEKKYREERILRLTEETITDINKGKKEINKIILPPWPVESKDLKQQKKEINFNITGWIGTLSSIEDKSGNEKNIINHGLIVYARNRVVISNMLKDIKTDRFYQSYIVGEIFAEDLDSDDLIDIINISRDNFSDQDERFPTLRKHILALVTLLIHEKEKIKKIKKGLKTKLSGKTTSNIISKLKEKGVSEEIIKTKIAPVFAEETNYKMTSPDPVIFISYMSIEKSPKSYHMSKIIFEIFKIGLKIEQQNVSIIYTASPTNDVPFHENNIMEYLKVHALAINLEKSAFIACITDTYTENWYTSVEYGASWVNGKDIFVLVDDGKISSKFKSPLAGKKYIDFSPIFNNSLKTNTKFIPLLLSLIKEILKSLKIQNIYSDSELEEIVLKVLEDNLYEISTIKQPFTTEVDSAFDKIDNALNEKTNNLDKENLE